MTPGAHQNVSQKLTVMNLIYKKITFFTVNVSLPTETWYGVALELASFPATSFWTIDPPFRGSAFAPGVWSGSKHYNTVLRYTKGDSQLPLSEDCFCSSILFLNSSIKLPSLTNLLAGSSSELSLPDSESELSLFRGASLRDIFSTSLAFLSCLVYGKKRNYDRKY